MISLLTNESFLTLIALAARNELPASALAPVAIATEVPEPTTIMLVLSGLLLAIPLMRKVKS